MPNDNAIVRLLYAILSQKCLKDIDWNKVAHDPVLQQEITNGHAARMRYSRFKKQMDGTSGVRKPRAPSTPRKPKADKAKSSKTKKERKQSGDHNGDSKIKAEVGAEEVGSSQESEEVGGSQSQAESPQQHVGSPTVKMEAGRLGHGYLTPMGSQSQTPSPGFGGSMSEMDEMMASFGMPGSHAHHVMTGDPQAMFQGAMVEGPQHGFGMGMHMSMGDPFEGLWHQAHQEEGEGGVSVKTEPRWEDAYRQV